MKLPPELHVCVIDPDPSVYNMLAPFFRAAGARLSRYDHAEQYLETEHAGATRRVVVTAHLPGMNGVELVCHLQHCGNEVSAVLIVAPDDVASAVRAMRHGAVDVIARPVDVTRLLHSLAAPNDGAGDRPRRGRRGRGRGEFRGTPH